nr:PREDICTED: ankyrin repeat domain-containing protein 24 [Latimeria chalumnae]|eukprot:XP_014345750.1 PREDICTED: ankyrin repeat domain-containing protein 24 [Latimeria chalumnae]
MKSLKAKFRKSESQDWSKHDEKLLQAVENNDPDKVFSLLSKKGLVPTKLDSEGKSAFHLSVMRGHMDCLEVILSHGVDVTVTDGTGYNALHLAAKNGHPECVRRLIQEKCSIGAVDNCGRTVLHHAAVNGNISCVETLCDFEAPLDPKDGDGSTPLILAAQMSHSELCRLLIERGADANARDHQGRTALMLACENDSLETVEVLFQNGVDIGIVDALGHDALHYSLVTGNAHILQLLHGAPSKGLWASEMELATPPSQHEAVSQPEKSVTPRKRRAPPPPSAPRPDNEEVFEEILKLRQERGRLLQTIRSLEQLCEKQRHQKQLPTEEDALQKLEEEVIIAETEEPVGFSFINWSYLYTLQSDKENTSYGIETPEEEEVELFEFPGTVSFSRAPTFAFVKWSCFNLAEAEKLLSKKSVGRSAEELIATLQSQLEQLTADNKDLQEKVLMLETYEKDDTEVITAASQDFIPVILYDSMKTEFDRLKEQYSKAQAELEGFQDGTTSDTSCRLVPAEAYEQLKADYEQQIQALQEALEETKAGLEHNTEATGEAREESESNSAVALDSEAQSVQELARKLEESQGKYEKAVAEVGRLKEQIQLGILSVEEKEAMASNDCSAEAYTHDLEEVKAELLNALQAKTEEEKKVKILEMKMKEMEETGAQQISLEEYEEMKMSLSISLEEVTKENAELLEKYKEADMELNKMKKALEKRTGGLDRNPETEKEAFLEAEQEKNKLSEELAELGQVYQQLEQKYEQLQVDCEKRTKELNCLKEELGSTYVSKQDNEKMKEELSTQLSAARKMLSDLMEKHNRSQLEVERLQKELENPSQDSVLLSKHLQIKQSLERSVQETKVKATQLEEELASKNKEIAQLRKGTEDKKDNTVSQEMHEQIKCSLQAEVNTLTIKLNDLMKKHEKTCTEVFQVQREALFMKSERHAAEAQLAAVEKQLKDLKSGSQKLQELQKHIEDSAGLVKEKDRKITELSKEVFRLKEALNSLSQQHSSAPAAAMQPNRQQTESLQGKVRSLQQKLADAEKQHKAIISVYRTHLLYAVQGQMDQDVHHLLHQILKIERLEEGSG